MKILITGGTGLVGQRLAKEAKKRGAQVTVFSRHANEDLKSHGIRIITGDLLSREHLKNACSDQDIVYHLAAEIDETSPYLWHINVEGTRNVVNACKKNNVKRLIFASSIGVLGQSDEPLKEIYPYNPETKYEKSKASAEKLITHSGIQYTIARMPPVLGPNKVWKQIFRAAERGYPIIGSGKNIWPLVYVDDVVDALLLMLRPAAKNKIYHITDGENNTYIEIYEKIAEVIECEPPTKHVPIWLANMGSFIYEKKCSISGKPPDVTKLRTSIARLTRNRPVTIEKAKKEISYAPKYGLEDALKKTWDELKGVKEENTSNTKN